MILLGMTRKRESGSSNNDYGYSAWSMEVNDITIIKEGSREELKKYVDEQRELSKSAKPKMSKLCDRLDNEDTTLSEKEYDKKYDKYKKDMYIDTFEKLLIVEGEIL